MKEYVLSENSQEKLIMTFDEGGAVSFSTIYWTGNLWKKDTEDRQMSLSKEEVTMMKKYLQKER